MKRIKNVACEGFYLLESRASANTFYFETQKECKTFINFWNRQVGSLIKIYDYLLMEDGWLMVVKIKSEEVFQQFWLQKKRSHVEQSCEFPENWRIFSEQVRLCLSSYAKRANRLRQRSGSFTHSHYKRYYFHHLKEALDTINRIRKSKIAHIQGTKRFRAKPRKFYKLRKLGKGHILINSRKLREKKTKVRTEFKSFVYEYLNPIVVANWVNVTVNLHKNPHPPP